jgi:hypothetical protein
MYDENCFTVEERLIPMFKDAVSRLSFGLTIVCEQFMFIPQLDTPQGPKAGFGWYFQCRGFLLGTQNYLATIGGITDPHCSQKEIDDTIQQACESMRAGLYQQKVAINGAPAGPTEQIRRQS